MFLFTDSYVYVVDEDEVEVEFLSVELERGPLIFFGDLWIKGIPLLFHIRFINIK